MQATENLNNASDTADGQAESDSNDGRTRNSSSIGGLFQTSSKLVQQAANILEEEIAAGIVAAKKAESRLFSIKRLRDEGEQELMQRFRKDAHEVIDIVMDLITMAAQYMDKIARMDISIGRDRGKQSSDSNKAGYPTIRLKEAVSPGATAEMFMFLENYSTTTTEEFNLFSTDLVNASGERISHDKITVEPEKIVIQPAGSSKVNISVKVSQSTPEGNYSGLIQAHNMAELRAILVISVSSP